MSKRFFVGLFNSVIIAVFWWTVIFLAIYFAACPAEAQEDVVLDWVTPELCNERFRNCIEGFPGGLPWSISTDIITINTEDDPAYTDRILCTSAYSHETFYSNGTVETTGETVTFRTRGNNRRIRFVNTPCRIQYDIEPIYTTEPIKCLECDR